MHLVFVDSVPWPYRVDAPFHRPIGGTQSALCYLMLELAGRGVRVSFINGAQPHEFGGVRALSTRFQNSAISDVDAIIVISDPTPENAAQFARHAPKAKKILWMHHAADQPAVAALADPAVCAAWDAIVFVSEWQRDQFHKTFPAVTALPAVILRNAIAPCFENMFDGMPILAFKSPAPLLAYASTPFRGLDRLLYGWPQVVTNHPSTQLQIFSDMNLYDQTNAPEIENLFATARNLPNIAHVGSVPQETLAEALRGTLVLAYPNTFEETACIAVMQALAAGCIVVTSDLGALPETLGGHGILMPVPDDATAHARDYAALLSQTITQLQASWQSGALEDRLQAQVAWVNDIYCWKHRAAEWQAWLQQHKG